MWKLTIWMELYSKLGFLVTLLEIWNSWSNGLGMGYSKTRFPLGLGDGFGGLCDIPIRIGRGLERIPNQGSRWSREGFTRIALMMSWYQAPFLNMVPYISYWFTFFILKKKKFEKREGNAVVPLLGLLLPISTAEGISNTNPFIKLQHPICSRHR